MVGDAREMRVTRTDWCLLLVLVAGLVAPACRRDPGVEAPAAGGDRAALVGAWRARIQFTSGAFAAVKDLEFMYVYNLGGTMTESSSYDAAPPVPPAYGIWRSIGRRQFTARYEFFVTRAPAGLDDLTGGGGWLPAGRGVLVETITLSEDGRSYRSAIRYDAYDQAGNPVPGGGEAAGHGVRIGF